MNTPILKILRDKYVIVLLVAGLWMLFFDRYNLFSQAKMRNQISQLNADKAYYEKGIHDLDYEADKLFNDPEELEKFARERYLMKKRNEDVFVVMEE
jgi:cell division protein FtsB